METIPLVYADLAGSLLKLVLTVLEKSGASAEEQERFFEEELAKFKNRDPKDLPDVED